MSRNETQIHPSAEVHKEAQLDEGVFVGPFSVIGEEVSLGKGTKIEAHVTITGHTTIGKECLFSPFTSIGTEPQDFTYQQEPTRVIIGDRNIFREFMTVDRGTVKGREETRIGNDNYFMAYSHIAHDCIIGNHTLFINGATLGGHCVIDDYAQVGALSGLHPFCRVGKYAFIGGHSVITQDILPFSRVAGSRPALLLGVNAIGLRRAGFSRDRIQTIKKIYKLLFYSDLNTSQAVEKIEAEIAPCEDRQEILGFISSSQRGILKKQQ